MADPGDTGGAAVSTPEFVRGMDVPPGTVMPEGFELGDGQRRLARCVENWPECRSSEYSPYCCRFPKSCSATSVPNQVYRTGDLEPACRPKATAATIAVTEYTVYPAGYDQDRTSDKHHFTIQVCDRGKGWAVIHGGYVLGKNGGWEYEPQPSSRDDDFYDTYRFTEDEAKRLALAAVETVTINGRTFAQVRRIREAGKRLYAVMIPTGYERDLQCTLLDENGEVLHRHISSSKNWGRRDLIAGMTSKYDVETRFPDGYELVEVDHWSDVPDDVLDAYRRENPA